MTFLLGSFSVGCWGLKTHIDPHQAHCQLTNRTHGLYLTCHMYRKRSEKKFAFGLLSIYFIWQGCSVDLVSLASHGSAVSKQAPWRSLLPISPSCLYQQNSSYCVFSSVALRIVILLEPSFKRKRKDCSTESFIKDDS